MKMNKCLIAATFIFIAACNRQPNSEWITQQSEYNNHWAISTEVGFILKSAWVDEAGNAWAISVSGIILFRQKGGSWVREVLPVANRRLYSITGRGKEVWVTGEEGLILYKQTGQPWVLQQQKAGLTDLNSVYVSGNDVYIVGSGGIILHKKDTADWEEEKCPEQQAILTTIKGTPDNLWIIGDSVILHKTANSTWEKETIEKQEGKLTDLFVQGNQVWVTGEKGILLHKTDNAKWVPEYSPAGKSRLDNIYGWADQVWVVADNGYVLYKKGSDDWRIDRKHPLNGYFLGGYCKQHDLWLVGNHNVILYKHENDPWVQEITPPSSEILTAITGNADHLIAVGFNETILQRNADGKWKSSHEMVTDAPLTGIYGLDDEAWVSDNKGNILYKNRDNSWQKETSGLSTLEIIDGYQYGDDIWLIGEPAVVLHKHGNGQWKNETPPFDRGSKLHGIYGRNDEIWIAGSNNILFHKKSRTQEWVNDYTGKTNNHFYGVTAIDDELYALAGSVTILHKKINTQYWEQETIDTREVRDVRDGHFNAICKTDSGLYAVGSDGLIFFKKNRGNWVREEPGVKGIDLLDIAEMDGTMYVAGNKGERGVIVYKNPGMDWVKLEKPWTVFSKIIKYKGLCFITKNGYLYKENNKKNLLAKSVVGSISNVIGAASCSGQLFFAAKNSIITVKPDNRQYPTVSRVRYFTNSLFNPDSLEVQFTIQSPPKERYKDLRQMGVEMFARAYNDLQSDDENYQPVKGSSGVIDTSSNSLTLAFRFEINNNFDIAQTIDFSKKLQVKVNVSSNTEGITEEITLKDEDGNAYLTVGNDVWNADKGRFKFVALALAIYYLFWLIWSFKPLWFLKVYQTGLLQQVAALKPPYKYLFIVADILRFLVYRPRVLDAWIKTHQNILTSQFRENKTVKGRQSYVSLPVSFDDQLKNNLVNEPDAAFCTTLFNTERTVVQLVGQGGAGKTMLAAALGKWMMQPHKHGKKRKIIRIPVFIESDTNILLQTLKELFHGWFNRAIDETFIIALLKHQRLVVIIDAFSERSAETQEHINNIHASIPVNALFITTRQVAKMKVNIYSKLSLTPFTAESMMHFITHLLKEKDDNPLKKNHEQIIFGKAILSRVKKQGKHNIITPMLVKMIVDNALENATASTNANEIIATIPEFTPEVYYDYLCNTHPLPENGTPSLSLQQVITVTEEMALLSLNEDFIPRDFNEEDIRQRILADPQYKDLNPIDRLVDNGIIARRNNTLGIFYLRFNLDTMAEYLGASRLYDKHRDDPHQLNALIEKVTRLGDEAAGFKIAFEHIKEYKMKNG